MAHITSTLNWSSAMQFLEHEDAIKTVTKWIIQFLSEAAKNNVLESWDTIIDALSPKHTQVCSVCYFNISSQATASDAGTMEHTTYHLIPRALWYAVEQNDVHNPPLPPLSLTSYLMCFSLVETFGVSARTGTTWEGRSSQRVVWQLALTRCGGHQLVWT